MDETNKNKKKYKSTFNMTHEYCILRCWMMMMFFFCSSNSFFFFFFFNWIFVWFNEIFITFNFSFECGSDSFRLNALWIRKLWFAIVIFILEFSCYVFVGFVIVFGKLHRITKYGFYISLSKKKKTKLCEDLAFTCMYLHKQFYFIDKSGGQSKKCRKYLILFVGFTVLDE